MKAVEVHKRTVKCCELHEETDKTVISQVCPDEEMPYIAESYTVDKYGVKHPAGLIERIDCRTNDLAPINRTIPVCLHENSITFRVDKARKHAAKLKTYEEKAEFLLDVIYILNKKEGKEVRELYNQMSPKEKIRFVDSCINLNPDGTLNTFDGIYIRWESFCKEQSIRDNLIELDNKYPDVFKPYEIFMPEPRWGRDIHVGADCIGYQYMMMLKQSGEKGFIVRAGGAVSDEGLPEKTNSKKVGSSWAASKPIRFGEYDTPGFLVITNPEDFALITALYRSSVDGRKYMCEAVISDDGLYNLPDYFVSRTVQIMQVYFKSLGIGIECIDEFGEIIGLPDDNEITTLYELEGYTLTCTLAERRQLRELHILFNQYLKEHVDICYDVDEAWDYILDHLPFKKKRLLSTVPKMFKDYMYYFGRTSLEE